MAPESGPTDVLMAAAPGERAVGVSVQRQYYLPRHRERSGLPLQAARQPRGGERFEKYSERARQPQPGQRGTGAEMRASPERDVPWGRARGALGGRPPQAPPPPS